MYVKIDDFLIDSVPIFDVRSPSEFLKGHIPEAYSFPLFSDSERAHVGTVYKQEGKDAAVKLGLSYVGPKLTSFIENAEKLLGANKTVHLYCWRGGMRSSSLAWLLQMAGFRCKILTGGYKTFRCWVLDQFKKKYQLIVLGGLTGSGKTDLLQMLKMQGEQVIDLEEVASHRGSSFGHLGFSSQPTVEHFENKLAWKLSCLDLRLPIWIEDESRRIGTCHIPEDLWQQMNLEDFLWIESPKEERVMRLLQHYGDKNPEDMILATERLDKKLGAVRTKKIIQSIKNQELRSAISMVLDYYDQTYLYSFQKRHRQKIELNYSKLDQELIKVLKNFSYEKRKNSIF